MRTQYISNLKWGILPSLFLFVYSSTLLPLIIWIPHHKKMWQTRVGEGCCCFWNVKKSIWIQIHLSKQLTLEDKFQFFKFEVQKGNPTLTNETSWTNVRLVNFKDLAKGSAGDSLSDWWLIQCFDCSYCSSKQAILEGKIDFKLCFHRGACTIPNTTLKEFLLKIQFSERKFSFLRLSFVPFLIGFLEFRPVTVTNFTHIIF